VNVLLIRRFITVLPFEIFVSIDLLIDLLIDLITFVYVIRSLWLTCDL